MSPFLGSLSIEKSHSYAHTLRCSELLSFQQDAVWWYVCVRRLAGGKVFANLQKWKQFHTTELLLNINVNFCITTINFLFSSSREMSTFHNLRSFALTLSSIFFLITDSWHNAFIVILGSDKKNVLCSGVR